MTITINTFCLLDSFNCDRQSVCMWVAFFALRSFAHHSFPFFHLSFNSFRRIHCIEFLHHQLIAVCFSRLRSFVRSFISGWYECTVFFINRSPELPKNGSWVHLDVHAPPRFNQKPPELLYVRLGESVGIQCEATATPSPTISWRKDGAPIQESPTLRITGSGHELQILNIQNNDIGTYYARFITKLQ